MNSDTLFTIFIAICFVSITALMVIWGVKEGKDSMKKLNQHLDEKQKHPQDREYEHSTY
jgi:hypothetical protein